MSEDFTDPDIADITVQFLGLTVSITGPADQASSLVSSLARHHSETLSQQHSEPASPHSSSFPGGSSQLDFQPPARPRPSSSVSDTSYSLVQSATARRPETRSQIEASFEPCPARFLELGGSLRGGSLSGERRAWKAGLWAKAVLDNRVATPNRTEALELRSIYYVVVRSSRVSRPCCFASSTSYWRVVGNLRGSSSISHSFPTLEESRTYCAGAGIELPEVQP